jgi:AraC family transcriptional regulator of adaptative response / DNA-3-methyladenine glycosylase II
MTRSMHETFKDSPTALRRRRRVHDRLVADGGLVCRLPFIGPYDWDAVLGFLAARAVPGVEAVDATGYRRTIRIGGAIGVVEVSAGDDDHLIARFHLPRWDDLIHHVGRVRHLFDLDHDPALPAAHFAHDRVLSPWPAGLRVPGCWDPFEAGVRAILGQQVSVAGATATAGRIVAAHGTPIDGLAAMGLSAAFPTADRLVDADLPIPGQRADAVRTFAAAHLAGDIALDGSMAPDEFESALCALPGVGPWTAGYLALRLGDPDAFPAKDLHVLRHTTGAEPRDVDPDAWRPWRAYATVRLWNL